MDWIAIIPALALLIVVHEYGHYRVARACGVKVLRFSVGFGRVLWRRRFGADCTEFTLSALPIGGYVRMLDESDGPVGPAERERAFNNRPLRQRVAVVAAGPLANLLLAVLLFAAVAWIGQQEPRAQLGTPITGSLAERAGLHAGEVVSAVSHDGLQWHEVESMPDFYRRVIEAALQGESLQIEVGADGHGRRRLQFETARLASREVDDRMRMELGIVPFREPVIRAVDPAGAGAEAGLQTGDRVLSINGAAIVDEYGVRLRIRESVEGTRGQVMRWRLERAGQPVELDVTPRVVTEGTRQVGRVGIDIGGKGAASVEVRHGFGDGLALGVERTWATAKLTLKTIGRMVIGQASLKNLSGPIAMADFAGQAARAGLTYYLGFLALVSVSLGVLNLLPLPMLDGGHLLYYLFEGLAGRPVSEWWQRQLQRVGALILVLIMVLALSNDITARLPGLH